MLTKWKMITITFLLQYDHADIERQRKYMVAHLADLCRPEPSLALIQGLSTNFTLHYRVNVRDGPLMLYVCNLSISKLMQQTNLLDARHAHQIVKQQ
jgi:hypothetical protein